MTPKAPPLAFKGYTTFDQSTLVEFEDKKSLRAVNMMGKGTYGVLETSTVFRVDRYEDQNRNGVIDEADKKATVRYDRITGQLIPYKTVPKGSQLLDSFTLETPVSSSDPHLGKELPKQGYQEAVEELKRGNPFQVFFLDRGVLGKLDEKDIKVEAYYPPSQILPQGPGYKPGLEGTMLVGYYVTKREIQSSFGRKVERLFKKARRERKQVSKLETLKLGVGEGTCSSWVQTGKGGGIGQSYSRNFSSPLSLTTNLGPSSYSNQVPDPADPAKCGEAYVRHHIARFQGQEVALSFGLGRSKFLPNFHGGLALYGIASVLKLKNNPLLDAAVIFNKGKPKERYGLHIDIGTSPY